jgi:ABC-type bacteriocin/lantibiotic exporter with double-glycine peptidase domain
MQNNHYDCGVACVCSILKFYNMSYNPDLISDLCKASIKGVSGYGIVKALKAHFVDCKGYQVESIEQIKSFPGIALIENIQGDHYVMILKIEKNQIIYHDPLVGKVKESKTNFNGKFRNIYFTCKAEFKTKTIKASKYHNLANQSHLFTVMLMAAIIFILTLFSNSNLKTIIDGEFKLISILLIVTITELFRAVLELLKNHYIASKVFLYKQKLNQKFSNLILSLNFSYFNRRTTSDYQIIYADNNSLADYMQIKAETWFYLILQLMFLSMIYVFYYPLAIIQTVVMSLMVLIVFVVSKVLRGINNLMYVANMELKNNFLEIVKGYQEIVSNNMTEEANKTFNTQAKNVFTLELSSLKKVYVIAFCYDMLITFNYVIVLLILMKLISNGLSEGTFVLVLTMFLSFNQIFKIYPVNASKLLNLRLSKARCQSLSEYAGNKHLMLKNDLTRIEFKNLSYAYSYGESLLSHLNFVLKKANIYFVTGDNGVGKSTIVQLIMGFLTPDTGHIYFNGGNQRKKITLINERSMLFNKEVWSNIVLNQPYDQTKLEQVSKKLNITDVLLGKLVYNFGANLSSGQRQLILLARSIYADDHCIILDEPFNYLASELKIKLLSIIRELSKTKLVIVVSHDRSIINENDKVINLKEDGYETINF